MCPKQIGGSAPRAEVGRTDARNGHHLRTHVDGTDPRRAEQTPFISQVVDLQGFWIRTRNALSRISSVKCCHLQNPGRLAWHDRTPVGCGVQPKRLVKVRERGRQAKAARPQPSRNHEHQGQPNQRPAGLRFRVAGQHVPQHPIAEAAATVDAAWQQGIRNFDTALLYGASLSEMRLGRALAKHKRGKYALW
jgi:hypothetical protein